MDELPTPLLPDFNSLVELYRQNPLAFEALRSQLLQAQVDAAAPRNRLKLEQTLTLIELTRRAAKNPVHAMVLANRLMWTAFGRLHRMFDEGTPLTVQERTHSAKVLVFAPRRPRDRPAR